jgi:nitroimidazol reductase NimA-like FMN-containing flavoprotein (pyridoxamine 5'-phosphate oxidase superfamily)
MEETLRANIIDLLARHCIMTLATIRPDGFPQATTVYYVSSGLVLHFATDPRSQKSGNIQSNNKVSVAIASETQNAYKLRGLSLSGTARRIADPRQVQDVQKKLFEAVPQAKRFAPMDARELAVYSITPIAISLVDYASGYGKSVLVEL